MPHVDFDTEFAGPQLGNQINGVIAAYERIALVWKDLPRPKRRALIQATPRLRRLMRQIPKLLADMNATYKD